MLKSILRKYATSLIVLPLVTVLFNFGPGLSVVAAGPWTQNFRNDYTLDQIELWITEGDVSFVSWNQPKKSGPWNTFIQTDDHLAGSGPVIQAGMGRWQVRFTSKDPFTMQWAEVLNGKIQESGSLMYNKGWTSSTDFDREISPVSIPTSFILFGSGLIGLVGLRQVKIRPAKGAVLITS